MYKVIRRFQERFDGDHDYNVGDTYPRDGFAPPDGRAEALCGSEKSDLNLTGAPFIKAVDEKPSQKAPATKKAPTPKKEPAAKEPAVET